jgi:hypothetical protein
MFPNTLPGRDTPAIACPPRRPAAEWIEKPLSDDP